MDGFMTSLCFLGKRSSLSPLAYMMGKDFFGLNLIEDNKFEPKLAKETSFSGNLVERGSSQNSLKAESVAGQLTALKKEPKIEQKAVQNQTLQDSDKDTRAFKLVKTDSTCPEFIDLLKNDQILFEIERPKLVKEKANATKPTLSKKISSAPTAANEETLSDKQPSEMEFPKNATIKANSSNFQQKSKDGEKKTSGSKTPEIAIESMDTQSTVNLPSMKQILLLKELFEAVCREDKLDISIYRQLEPQQLIIARELLRKRFKSDLLKLISPEAIEIMPAQPDPIALESFIIQKRADHCYKTAMSIRLSILKQVIKNHLRQNQKVGARVSLKAIKDFLLEKYYHPLHKQCLSREFLSAPYSQLFSMKRGMTRTWFSFVSSKLLKDLRDIQLDQIKVFYFNKLNFKLEEIFGPHVMPSCNLWFEQVLRKGFDNSLEKDSNESFELSNYARYMLSKINSDKFKMPMSKFEIETCNNQITDKIESFARFNSQVEIDRFCNHFGGDCEKGRLAYNQFMKEESPLYSSKPLNISEIKPIELIKEKTPFWENYEKELFEALDKIPETQTSSEVPSGGQFREICYFDNYHSPPSNLL